MASIVVFGWAPPDFKFPAVPRVYVAYDISDVMGYCTSLLFVGSLKCICVFGKYAYNGVALAHWYEGVERGQPNRERQSRHLWFGFFVVGVARDTRRREGPRESDLFSPPTTCTSLDERVGVTINEFDCCKTFR